MLNKIGNGEREKGVEKNIEKNNGRSRLMEELRNNRLKSMKLRDMENKIVEFYKDKNGYRLIKKKIESDKVEEKKMVLYEIIKDEYSIMKDVFGKYVIKKLFEFGKNEKKNKLEKKVRGNVLKLELKMYGCRVIKKDLE
jgi:pumilio RNA-binding family